MFLLCSCGSPHIPFPCSCTGTTFPTFHGILRGLPITAPSPTPGNHDWLEVWTANPKRPIKTFPCISSCGYKQEQAWDCPLPALPRYSQLHRPVLPTRLIWSKRGQQHQENKKKSSQALWEQSLDFRCLARKHYPSSLYWVFVGNETHPSKARGLNTTQMRPSHFWRPPQCHWAKSTCPAGHVTHHNTCRERSVCSITPSSCWSWQHGKSS